MLQQQLQGIRYSDSEDASSDGSESDGDRTSGSGEMSDDDSGWGAPTAARSLGRGRSGFDASSIHSTPSKESAHGVEWEGGRSSGETRGKARRVSQDSVLQRVWGGIPSPLKSTAIDSARSPLTPAVSNQADTLTPPRSATERGLPVAIDADAVRLRLSVSRLAADLEKKEILLKQAQDAYTKEALHSRQLREDADAITCVL